MIIDEDIYHASFQHFVTEVQRVESIISKAADCETNEYNNNSEFEDVMISVEYNSDDDLIQDTYQSTVVDEHNTEAYAISVCQAWMQQHVDWKLYLHDNSLTKSDQLLTKELITVHGRFQHVDPLMWFWSSLSNNDNQFRAIRVLAGCWLSRVDTGAFQELVFSMCGNNMNKFQT